MLRRKVLFLAGLAAMVFLAVLGCSLLVRDDRVEPVGSGWYIKLQIQAPAAAKAVTVTDFDVTGMNIQVLDPQDLPLASIDWVLADGTQSYPVPVQQAGEHEVVVTHYGVRDGQPVQATERAACNIQAMKITIVDIVPGCIGVIRVEGGEPPEPVDLTGYWDAILTPEGGTPNPPHLLYFKQTGSSLNCSDGLTGTVEGMEVTLVIPDFETTLVGTLGADGRILGTMELWGQTLAVELRRSVLDFGTFALSGLMDLNTDRGLASRGEDRVSYRLEFHIPGTLQGTLSFWNVTPLPPGTYAVVPASYGNDPGPNAVGAWLFENWETMYDAESGTLTLGRNDSTGASGSFAVQFEGGNSLSGSFELNPPTYSGGVVAITGGYWDGIAVMPATAGGRIWSSGVEMDWADCNVFYLDENRKVELSFSPSSGPLAAGTYSVPDQLWLHVSQRYDDEIDEFEAEAESGTLVITRFEEGVGISGYFQSMAFPEGALTGNFDVSFELSNYE